MDSDETWQVELRPQRTKPCTFPAKSRYGFRRERKKWVAEALFFCYVYDAPLLPLSLNRFPQNFPQTRVQVASRDTWFHIPEKFPLRDRIFRKTLFLGYPICDQPTGHGKRSATPTLFPSPFRHPIVNYLGDFCWGMYRFPAIHVRTSSFATVSATAKRGCLYFFQTYSPGGATIGSPICTATLLQCTFSS